MHTYDNNDTSCSIVAKFTPFQLFWITHRITVGIDLIIIQSRCVAFVLINTASRSDLVRSELCTATGVTVACRVEDLSVVCYLSKGSVTTFKATLFRRDNATRRAPTLAR